MTNTIVIFGASGDLTSRKLIPALYELYRKKRLPSPYQIIGFSRSKFSHEEFRNKLAEKAKEFVGKFFSQELWDEFSQRIFYYPGDIGQVEDFKGLRNYLRELEQSEEASRVYYLSTAPRFYEPAIAQLGEAGLADETNGPRRVVIEKPFGTDLATAQELNQKVHKGFNEKQIYRIDHYLGKETVQNLLVFRFANTIFEPLWNRNYIEHIQITAAEEVTVGRRGGYYDTSGILRDMFQNHLLQLMMITAMEAPAQVEADAVRNEKVKVLSAVRPISEEFIKQNTIRAQYKGYREEPGVDPNSKTGTFAAMKLMVDNWRWQGVPFYLRSGKGMSCRSTQIVIQFREPPHMLFDEKVHGPSMEGNRLVIQIQPAEGIQLHFQTKVPDQGMRARSTELDFKFHEAFESQLPEAYQRLLLDTMQGDASLFARADEVELAWGIIDPIMKYWEANNDPPIWDYELGFWGPDESTQWMRDQGREWFDTCPVLSPGVH